MHGKINFTPDFVLENIGLIRKYRVGKGFTRQNLAVRSGISIEMLGRYERRVCLPGKENYNKLADIFCWQKWE